MDNWNCCGSGPHSGPEVRVLPLSKGSNLILCKLCYSKEMRYRRERIAEDVPFDLPKWDDLKVYPEDPT